ncbi:uncharacterized protein B0H18DRAFT_981772 [Fomitopsis serialis]|uniref:uncharacterized protein n=1 Tax=Fomitopsis serialis TaxID=139415 RepID=UPI002007E91A|nr:uncharacterized protein B0H18DRAFT_981772 [Neoantrodia serialis]KAH9933728.1 hypothetical protein B0H18DRAFT_981772 [Neoantrodia serialis]
MHAGWRWAGGSIRAFTNSKRWEYLLSIMIFLAQLLSMHDRPLREPYIYQTSYKCRNQAACPTCLVRARGTWPCALPPIQAYRGVMPHPDVVAEFILYWGRAYQMHRVCFGT